MFEVVEMPNNWPVEVNYHEAKAFCKWKGKDYRVLTEAEHHAIREKDLSQITSTSDELIYQHKAKVNHNLMFGSSTVSSRLASRQPIQKPDETTKLLVLFSQWTSFLPTPKDSTTSLATCGSGLRTTSTVCQAPRPITSTMTFPRPATMADTILSWVVR